MQKLHFISGLPRSGSTLLAGLLRQNPRFAAAMTGPVGGLVGALLNAMGPQTETAVFLDEAKRQAKEEDEKRNKEALAAKFAHIKDDPNKETVEL